MKINLIRLANTIDPKAPYLKDSEQFLEDLNNELFDFDLELVENEKDTQFSVIFIETGGSETKFKEIYQTLKEPYVLISDSKNNSLPACFEIKTFLENRDIICHLFIGSEKDIAKGLDRLSNVFAVRNKFASSTLGVIGAPSDWLIASTVNYEDVKKKFGITLVDISLDEFYEEMNKDHSLTNVPHYKELKEKWKNKDELDQALQFYKTLKVLVKKHNLSALTLRCFDLIQKYKNTACLAFSLLNEEGIVATCEGDIPSLLTMYAVKCALNMPSFQVNPSQISLKDNSAILSHCTIPLNMCAKYELMTHFESGLGIGVKGELKKQPAMLLKILPDLKGYMLFKCEIADNCSLSNYCRTQINVSFDEESLYSLLNINFGNHIILVYGNDREELFRFFALFKMYPEM